jgi:BASS family bile acid:Na+ symporter
MDSVLLRVLIPMALGIVMLGVGMNLTPGDFTRVIRYPKAAVIALACQMLLMPWVALGLVLAADLRPELAVGMMLLAASPGGATASLYSHLFRGDVALNVTLTAVNSVLALFTLPLVVNLSLNHFMGAGASIGLQLGKVLQVFAIVLVPISIGMVVRRRYPGFTARAERPVKIISVVVLFIFVIFAMIAEADRLLGYVTAVGLVVIGFGMLSLLVGYWVPRLARVERRQSIASSMEVGIHNSTLAITVAISPTLLGNTQMAIPAAVYGALMFFPTVGFGYLLMRRRAAETDQRADDQLPSLV